MPARSLIIGFLWRLALIYGLLIFPWPGWNQLYGEGFCAVGNDIFGRRDAGCLLYFEAARQTRGLASLDSQIVLGNPQLADKSGNGPALKLGLNTRAIGWIPTALIIALVAATPIPWPRRLRALFLGLVLTQAFILASVAIYIGNESTEVSLRVLSPFWKQVFADGEYTLITQMGASFSVPLLIWILVTFREQDRKLLVSNQTSKTSR
jgi:hypothetical protein